MSTIPYSACRGAVLIGAPPITKQGPGIIRQIAFEEPGSPRYVTPDVLADIDELARLARRGGADGWNNRMRRIEGPLGGRQYFSEVLEPIMVADQTAVTASAAETAMWTMAQYAAVGANFWQPGKVVRLAAWGIQSSAATPGTVTITPRWGTATSGTALGASAAITQTASLTNVPWFMECKYTCRGVGTAGTLVGGGNFASQAVANASFGGTTATIDTTATTGGFWFGITFSAASQSLTTKGLFIEALN